MEKRNAIGAITVWLVVSVQVATIASPVTYDLRPSAETFVVNPDPTNTAHSNGANHNYGGAGSRSISAAAHHADGADPKGRFDSLLRFDGSTLTESTIEKLELQLYILNGNTGANGIFNSRGAAGTVNVYWMENDGDWVQGYDTPSKNTVSTTGLTYNSLQTHLASNPASLLTSFYYDGSNAYPTAQWFTYDISASLGNTAFTDALLSGEPVTLLLSPGDDDVCLNFTAYLQNAQAPTNPTYRTEGPHLLVTTPEPTSLALLLVALAGLSRRPRRAHQTAARQA